MSEIIQEKKQLTFEDIAPLWYQYLTGGKKSRVLEMGDYQYCVVGESHGFKTADCFECHKFGLYFIPLDAEVKYEEPYTPSELNKLPDVQAFVKHFNEVHVK
jgi:hypothetical protein